MCGITFKRYTVKYFGVSKEKTACVTPEGVYEGVVFEVSLSDEQVLHREKLVRCSGI